MNKLLLSAAFSLLTAGAASAFQVTNTTGSTIEVYIAFDDGDHMYSSAPLDPGQSAVLEHFSLAWLETDLGENPFQYGPGEIIIQFADGREAEYSIDLSYVQDMIVTNEGLDFWFVW